MKEARHICVYGASGSGKTFYALNLIKGAKRVIAFDPMGEFSGKHRFKAVSCDGRSWRKELLAYMQANWSKGFQIALTYDTSPALVGHEVYTFLKAVQKSYLDGKSLDKVVVVLEEADQLIPNQSLPAEISSLQIGAPTKARHYGIDLLVLTQRPQLITTTMRDNSQAQVFFRLGSRSAQQFCGDELAGAANTEHNVAWWRSQLAGLTTGQHWILRNGQVSNHGPGIDAPALKG